MVERSVPEGGTLGADKGYDTADFVQTMRLLNVLPHVAAKKSGSAIDAQTIAHAGYSVSLKKRKLVEEIFGWAKSVGGLRKTRFIGLAKVTAQTIFTFACYNLTRMATLLGWRLSAV
jgi:IS5 family transposase